MPTLENTCKEEKLKETLEEVKKGKQACIAEEFCETKKFTHDNNKFVSNGDSANFLPYLLGIEFIHSSPSPSSSSLIFRFLDLFFAAFYFSMR